MERRLAAILAADVVGYSRLVREDEAGTLAALKAHREQLIQPKVAEHKGRIVKLMGDGLLIEFPSAVEAVLCAVEIQHMIGDSNAGVPEENRIAYRIGINIGDIVVEDDDIYGDGVNVAARLEGLAEPNGISVARNVFNQVKDKLDLTMALLGEREVKNIAEPVTVYRVVLDDKAAALVTPVVQDATKPVTRRWAVAAAAAVLFVAAVGGMLWWHPWAPNVEPATSKPMALPLADKPSIAVLPFNNMSGDPEQEYFADGITDDLITDLAKISGLAVIARNSTFAYKGQSPDVRDVARQLGVRYVVEGSVRKAGGRIRINAQLIDAETGSHLWAERYDRKATDVFDLQDEVRTKILAALTLRLTPEEKRRVERRHTTDPEAYDRWMRGRYALSNFTRPSLDDAIQQFERAIARDPSFARAYGSLANALISQVSNGWVRNPEENVERAMDMAARAVAFDDMLPEARLVLARVYIRKRNYDRALSEIDKAVAFDPNFADGYAYRASVLVYSGRPQDALIDIDKASNMNRATPGWYHDVRGRALFSSENFKAAATAFEKSLQQNPNYNQSRLFLAAAYAHMGALDEAAWELSELDASGARVSLDHFKSRFAFRRPSDTERVIQGLRKAGLTD